MHRLLAIAACLWSLAVLGQPAPLPPVPGVVYECGFSYHHVPYLLKILPSPEVAVVAGQEFCGNPGGGPELRGSFVLRLSPLRQPDVVSETRLDNCLYVHSADTGWTASGRVPIQVVYRDEAPPLIVVRRYHSCNAMALWFFVPEFDQPGIPIRTVHFSTGGDGTTELLGTDVVWIPATTGRRGSLAIIGYTNAGWGHYLSQFSQLHGAANTNAFIRSGLYTDQAGTYRQAVDWFQIPY